MFACAAMARRFLQIHDETNVSVVKYSETRGLQKLKNVYELHNCLLHN